MGAWKSTCLFSGYLTLVSPDKSHEPLLRLNQHKRIFSFIIKMAFNKYGSNVSSSKDFNGNGLVCSSRITKPSFEAWSVCYRRGNVNVFMKNKLIFGFKFKTRPYISRSRLYSTEQLQWGLMSLWRQRLKSTWEGRGRSANSPGLVTSWSPLFISPPLTGMFRYLQNIVVG